MEIEIGQEKSRVEKFLDWIPKIDKFLWFLDLNLGVLITAVVMLVLFILYGTLAAYEDGLGDGIVDRKTHKLGPLPIIIVGIVVLVNVIFLTLVIVGIQKEKRKLLASGLIWFPIYTIFHIVIVVLTIFLYHWYT